MKIEKFEYQVLASVSFDRNEIWLIRELGLVHYDRLCRAACMLGGFIYGIENHFMIAETETVTAELTAIEIGLIGKICEMELSNGITQKCLELINSIHSRLLEVRAEPAMLESLSDAVRLIEHLGGNAGNQKKAILKAKGECQ